MVFFAPLFSASIIYLVTTLLLFTPATSFSEDTRLYYACLNESIKQGKIFETSLDIYPSDEYRFKKLYSEKVKAVGRKQPNISMVSNVQHQAIANLLAKKGLRSVSNVRYLRNGYYEEAVSVRYEGVLKLPLRFLNYQYSPSGIEATLEIEFSPLSSPQHWKYQHAKKEVLDYLKEVGSIFYLR